MSKSPGILQTVKGFFGMGGSNVVITQTQDFELTRGEKQEFIGSLRPLIVQASPTANYDDVKKIVADSVGFSKQISGELNTDLLGMNSSEGE